MSASKPMDIDPRPSVNGVEADSRGGEVKVASFDGAADSHQAPHTDPSSRPSGPRLPGVGDQDRPGDIPHAGDQPSQKDAIANDASTGRITPERSTQDVSRRDSSPEPILDEIVVATRRRSLSQDKPQSSDENEKPEAQFAPVTPTERQTSETREAAKTPNVGTTQARFELKDDEATITATRRNPKRDAAEMVEPQTTDPPGHEELLDDALAPMKAEELEEWDGWVELESEPAFFNFILRDLGAKDVQIQEVLCMDDELIRQIPKPVHGLIFLFQYVSDEWDVDEESDTNEVWFANQTVDNACATIAMMNIIMNAPGVELGDTLKEFKEATKTMSSPLRGHALSTNKFIRKVHNSFTRRLDHFNADLWLSNKAEASKRKKRTKGKKSKKGDDSGYHFIAYVPVNGHVWELDGLRARPAKLDPVTSGDWAIDALPKIWSRMEEYGGGFEFNLLAMCQSPLRDLCRDIAANARVLELIERRLEGLPEGIAKPELPVPEKFPEYQVTPAMVAEAPVSPKVHPLLRLLGAIPNEQAETVSTTGSDTTVPVPRVEFTRAVRDALDKQADPPLGAIGSANPPPGPVGPAEIRVHLEALARKTAAELGDAVARHGAEILALATDLERVEGRKRDYTPAIHAWVKILAEKGVLEQIAG